MITQQEFGEKLKAFRKNRHQNQETLATIAHTTKATISRWEQGKMTPNVLDIIRICQHYNITMEEMLDLKKKCII